MVFGIEGGLDRNGPDAVQVTGQFGHPFAGGGVVGIFSGELDGGADVRDLLESKHAAGAAHIVPENCHGLKVNAVQGVPNIDDILPAVLQIGRNAVCNAGFQNGERHFLQH